jgi:anaerobic magnesium-protoporphyrin IX monomethyl ester cyclase
MIFFGAESGSDWVLQQMDKQLTADKTLALAERIRHFGIIPEFSFIMGNPQDPERDVRECLAFIRKLKKINPQSEIIVYPYVPTPQREGMYGGVDGRMQFPDTPEEWASERWYKYTVRSDPNVPWLPRRLRRRIADFERVVNCRWPTVQDIRMPRWGRALLPALASWRYAMGIYSFPVELQWAERLVDLRKPRFESL